MKNTFLLLMAMFPAILFGQENKFKIIGTIGTYNKPAKVYLRYYINKATVIDSVTPKNGVFSFSNTFIGDPLNAVLAFSKKGDGFKYDDYKQLFLENGNITVSATDSIAKSVIKGTPTNDDNSRYNEALKVVNDAYNILEAKQKNATTVQKNSTEFEKENNKTEKSIEAQELAINKKFIQENPNSYLSLVVMESVAYSADYTDLEQLYNGLSANIKATDAGKKFGERLPKLKLVAIGSLAPDFAEADTSGKLVSLSSFKGKYVLVDFWASWCSPCRRENPNVVKVFNRFKKQNFTVLGVSLDRPGNKEKWLKAIHNDGLAWTHVSDLKFWDSKTAALYVVRAIPQNFLIDPNGKIIGKNLRGEDLENKLEELLGKI